MKSQWSYEGHVDGSNVPVSVQGVSGVIHASLSGIYWSGSCVVLSGGSAKCWGNSTSFLLGDGNDYSSGRSLLPVTVSGLSNGTQVVAGNNHSCALISGGSVKCWGGNGNGQLGDGTTASKSTPVSVSGLSGVSEISAGYDTTCARLSDGIAKCWGRAKYGRLGNDNDTTNQLTPVSVSGLTGVSQISSFDAHSCAVIGGNAVKCWGYNAYGQLGTTDKYNRLTPIQAGE